MPRRALITTSVTLLVLAAGSAPGTAALLELPGTTDTLRNATWDAAPGGPVAPETFKRQLGGGSNDPRTYDDSSVAADSRGSGKVYRVRLQAGTTWNRPTGNNGIVTFVPLARQVDNACLAYDVRFDPNFDWSLGGKLPGLEGVAPGVSPSVPAGGGNAGSRGWSGRMMWLTPRSYSWAGPTNMAVSYMYSPEQTSYYGDNVRWNRSFVAGRWHRVKQCFTMNTVGLRNGRLQAWFDGTKVVDRTDYVFRTRNDVRISHLVWSVFRGGSDSRWAGSRDDYIDFDNVTVTTVR